MAENGIYLVGDFGGGAIGTGGDIESGAATLGAESTVAGTTGESAATGSAVELGATGSSVESGAGSVEVG